MKFILHPYRGMAHHKPPMEAFAEGVKAHGHEAVMSDTETKLEGDVDVIWSEKQSHCCINRKLILECGYINGTSGDYQADRHRFVSVSWDAQHGLGAQPPLPPADRWEALEIDLEPWKAPGGDLLWLGQHPGDYMAPDRDRQRELMNDLADWYDRITVRQHPKVATGKQPALDTELFRADAAATWASTAAVEAVIAGVPCYTFSDYSIAEPVTSQDPGCEYRGERLAWAHTLAYRQWTYDEFRSGEAWEWLKFAVE